MPTLLKYGTHIEKGSLFNTPNTFAIYMVDLVCQWLEEQGGLAGMEEINTRKADLLYAAIDGSDGFYRCPVEPASRSVMNVVFRLPSEELEAAFVSESKAAGLVGLKGHRSVGGIRASIYNATGIPAVEALVGFMKDFAAKNG